MPSNPRLASSSAVSGLSFAQAGELSLPMLVDLRAEETPTAPAIASVRRTLTFAEWRAGAARFSWVLQDSLGEVHGERVLVWLGNDQAHDFACVLHGLFVGGAIAVPLDDRLTATEVRGLIDETDPRALIVGQALVGTFDESKRDELGIAPSTSADGVMVIPVRERALESVPLLWSFDDCVPEVCHSPARPESYAVIFYSSGSTGRPKGALWRHMDWVQYSERATNAIYALPRGGKPLGPDDVLQSPIPQYTAGALMENSYCPAFSGCMLAVDGTRFDPARSQARMTELGTTIFNGAPPHFAMLCDLPPAPPPPSLELLITGGSAFTRPLYERMLKRWPQTAIANWYGLMESGVGQTLSWGDDLEREPEAIGRLIWPGEARVVDAELNDVHDGAEGELWLRAPGQIDGYFRNAEQTAKRLHEGWVRTGDRVLRDTDGLYHSVGRGEDRINRGGFKFYPVEIESVLEAHQDVREAGVIGVPHPVLGEDVVAFVVPATGRQVTEEELRTHCRTRLAPNKVPTRIWFEEALPRNGYGKLVRRELASRHRQLASG